MIIGFTASMGAGKSTAVDLLKKKAGHVELVKFAQPLYDMQEFVYDRISSVHKRSENFIKDRKLLQWLGTDWGRDTISETLWVDLWKAKVRNTQEKHAYAPNLTIVCDDVRFDNEASTVQAIGGVVVHITCNRNKERIDTTSGLCNHKSEAGVNPKLVDYTVSNNGTIKEFEVAIRNLYGLISHKERNRL